MHPFHKAPSHLDAHNIVVWCLQCDILLLVGASAEDLVELPFTVPNGLFSKKGSTGCAPFIPTVRDGSYSALRVDCLRAAGQLLPSRPLAQLRSAQNSSAYFCGCPCWVWGLGVASSGDFAVDLGTIPACR
eukprot:1157690-Pelagomonas_calceolata.AAC.3